MECLINVYGKEVQFKFGKMDIKTKIGYIKDVLTKGTAVFTLTEETSKDLKDFLNKELK